VIMIVTDNDDDDDDDDEIGGSRQSRGPPSVQIARERSLGLSRNVIISDSECME